MADQGNEFALFDLQINPFEGQIIASPRQGEVLLNVLNINECSHGCLEAEDLGAEPEKRPGETNHNATHQDKANDEKAEHIFPAREGGFDGGKCLIERLRCGSQSRFHGDRSCGIAEKLTDQG